MYDQCQENLKWSFSTFETLHKAPICHLGLFKKYCKRPIPLASYSCDLIRTPHSRNCAIHSGSFEGFFCFRRQILPRIAHPMWLSSLVPPPTHLYKNALDVVCWKPSRGGEKLHANAAPKRDVAGMKYDMWGDNTDKGGSVRIVKRKGGLESEWKCFCGPRSATAFAESLPKGEHEMDVARSAHCSLG